MEEPFSYASSSSDYSSDDDDVADLDSASPLRKTGLSSPSSTLSPGSAVNDSLSLAPESSASSALTAARSQDGREGSAGPSSSPSKSLGGHGNSGSGSGLKAVASYSLKEITVTTPKLMPARAGRASYTAYCVIFGFSDTNQRCVWKRFSEFEALRKAIAKKHTIVRNYKEFPRKSRSVLRSSSTSLSSPSASSLGSERCLKLDAFLKFLVTNLYPLPKELSEWIQAAEPTPPTSSSSSFSSSSSSSSSPRKSVHFAVEGPPLAAASSNQKDSSTETRQAADGDGGGATNEGGGKAGGDNDDNDNDDDDGNDDDDDDDGSLIRACSDVARRSLLDESLTVATPSPSPSPTRAGAAAAAVSSDATSSSSFGSERLQPGSESFSSVPLNMSTSASKSSGGAAQLAAAATAVSMSQEPSQEPYQKPSQEAPATGASGQVFPHMSLEKQQPPLHQLGNGRRNSGTSNHSSSSSSSINSDTNNGAASNSASAKPEKRRGSSFSSSSSITGLSLRAKAGSFLKISSSSSGAAPSPSRKSRANSSSSGVHTANDDQYGAGGDNPGNNTPVSFSSASSASSSAAAAAAPSVLQQFSEADVALAVKRAEETITARYAALLAAADSKALESSSQKHQETLTIAAANAHTREEELQRLLAAASANEQQALKVCKEMEASTAQLQTQFAALTHRHNYCQAISHLHVRIQSWERDAKEGHVRFLVHVKSFNSFHSIPPPPDTNYNVTTTTSCFTSSTSADAIPPAPKNAMPPRYSGNALRDSASSGSESRASVSQYSTDPGNVHTLVRRRFSEFVELASSLHSAWPLPPRGIMGNTILGLTPAELAGRATALESFLQHLVDTVAVERSSVLRSFLRIPPWQPLQATVSNANDSSSSGNRSSSRGSSNNRNDMLQPFHNPSGKLAISAAQPPLPLPHYTDDRDQLLAPKVLFPPPPLTFSSSSSSSSQPPLRLPPSASTSTFPEQYSQPHQRHQQPPEEQERPLNQSYQPTQGYQQQQQQEQRPCSPSKPSLPSPSAAVSRAPLGHPSLLSGHDSSDSASDISTLKQMASNEPVTIFPETAAATPGEETALPLPSLASGEGSNSHDNGTGSSDYDSDESDSRDTTVL